MAEDREVWTSKFGFILAATGSAVGLGNIWRFPYIAGTNGGAAFLILYLVGTVLIGYPILVAEMTIGRKTKKNPVGAFKKLATNTNWWLVGALGVLTGFIVLSYYSVIAGWALSYVIKAARGFESGMDFAQLFNAHISGVRVPLFWHAIFMLLVIGTVRAGVVKGIQKIAEILMPILLLILLALVFRSVTLEGAAKGLSFYLAPDFTQVNAQTILDAIAQAFFTLSLGMGAIVTYGSYLSEKDGIVESANYILVFDVVIAILAGFVIFPAVFALGFDPATGPGLVFITLPAVFAEMPLGSLFGFLFFLLFTIAALTSAVSLLEVVVSYVVDEHAWSRKMATKIVGSVIFLVGIPPLLGYSFFAEFTILGMNILDLYDWLANSIFLPLGGVLTAIFAAYIWGAKATIKEANKAAVGMKLGYVFAFLIKYLVPLAVIIVMISGVWQTIVGKL